MTKQVTWRKISACRTTGTIKGRNFRITLIERDRGDWRLGILNREFPFASLEAAKSFCETHAFMSVCDALAAQWAAVPAKAAAAAQEATTLGLGRGCVSAPETFVF